MGWLRARIHHLAALEWALRIDLSLVVDLNLGLRLGLLLLSLRKSELLLLAAAVGWVTAGVRHERALEWAVSWDNERDLGRGRLGCLRRNWGRSWCWCWCWCLFDMDFASLRSLGLGPPVLRQLAATMGVPEDLARVLDGVALIALVWLSRLAAAVRWLSLADSCQRCTLEGAVRFIDVSRNFHRTMNVDIHRVSTSHEGQSHHNKNDRPHL